MISLVGTDLVISVLLLWREIGVLKKVTFTSLLSACPSFCCDGFSCFTHVESAHVYKERENIWICRTIFQLGFQSLDVKQKGKIIRPMASKTLTDLKVVTELPEPVQLYLSPLSPTTSSSPWNPTYRTSESDAASLLSVCENVSSSLQ